MVEQGKLRQVEQIRILLVEDSPTDAQIVRRALRQTSGTMDVFRGLFDVIRADRLAMARLSLEQEAFDVVLLDLQLPDSQGLDTLAEVRAAAGDVPIVVLTGFDDDGLALAAIQRGAQDYASKDHLDGRLLRRTIRHAIERQRAEVQLRRHAREVETAHAHIEKQAAELKARAEQLDRINRELDDFAYIASHDLKEPLRGIAAYCGILLEDYGQKIDATGRRRLETLVGLCQRLETLIGDLLTYCRVGGTRPAETGIELSEVVDEVLEAVRPVIDRRGASVEVADRLPQVTGDATLIGMAIGNLISNAVKFNNLPRPRVQIGALPTDPATIYVRDDGIGIDRRHHEAIFTIFRRLHGRKEYDGTGVGLTIVRKIVEAHGGRIWLESEPGSGTTFLFTLAPPTQKPTAEPAPRPPHWAERPRKLAKGRESSAGLATGDSPPRVRSEGDRVTG